MADVINLADRAARSGGRRDETGPCEATILMFTGVRYERLAATDDSDDSTGRTNPPRRAGGGKGKKH